MQVSLVGYRTIAFLCPVTNGILQALLTSKLSFLSLKWSKCESMFSANTTLSPSHVSQFILITHQSLFWGTKTGRWLTSECELGPGRTRANFVYFQFLARKKLAKISQGPNFGGGRIRPTCLSQNFADWHVCHVTISTVKKTSRALLVQEWIVIYRWLFSRLSGFCWILCFSLNRTTQRF